VSRSRVAVALLAAASGGLALVGCSSSSGPDGPTIQPAKIYRLAGFTTSPRLEAGMPVRLSFAVEQPSGAMLMHYRRGGGPHTGVHLIVVRSDLGVLIHRHPPISADGRIRQTLVFPTAGRYRVVVDAYPGSGTQRNLQLFRWVDVSGDARPGSTPLTPSRSVTVEGYRFTLHGRPRLRAIQAGFLTITVTRPDGTPATFTPWYGALAHAIFFRKGTLDYFHTHVCSPGASGCTAVLGSTKVTGRSSKPGELTVGVLVPVAGTWRLFLQTRADGRVLTAPFTLQVR
jgi:hypothetical protein